MITRAAKVVLVAGLAIYYTLVVFNNVTDFDSNYQFVRHVLMMDTTFPGNHGIWRALPWRWAHLLFYLGIIAWEMVTTVLLWWAVVRLGRAVRGPASGSNAAGFDEAGFDEATFNKAKGVAVIALTLAMTMWLVAFLSVGAEWFLMWQSRAWNGQEAAFRMFAVVGVVLLIVLQPDGDGQA
jgi:predicted small integral membrane protein